MGENRHMVLDGNESCKIKHGKGEMTTYFINQEHTENNYSPSNQDGTDETGTVLDEPKVHGHPA